MRPKFEDFASGVQVNFAELKLIGLTLEEQVHSTIVQEFSFEVLAYSKSIGLVEPFEG